MRSYHIRKMVVLQKDEKGFGTYFEIPYTEYRTDGSIYSKGTEDFSSERYNRLVRRTIYLPTGKTNKGGYMIWEEKETIVSDSTASIRGYAKIKYPTKNFQIRQY